MDPRAVPSREIRISFLLSARSIGKYLSEGRESWFGWDRFILRILTCACCRVDMFTTSYLHPYQTLCRMYCTWSKAAACTVTIFRHQKREENGSLELQLQDMQHPCCRSNADCCDHLYLQSVERQQWHCSTDNRLAASFSTVDVASGTETSVPRTEEAEVQLAGGQLISLDPAHRAVQVDMSFDRTAPVFAVRIFREFRIRSMLKRKHVFSERRCRVTE
jgi:hypothetical protein